MGSEGWLKGTEDLCAQQPWLLAQEGVIPNAPDAFLQKQTKKKGSLAHLFPQSPVGADVSMRAPVRQ